MKTFFPPLISLLFSVLVGGLSAQTTSSALAPVQAVTATGGLQPLNVSGYGGFSTASFQSLNTAGTTPTLAAKLQGSAAPVVLNTFTTAGATDNKLRAGASTTVKLAVKFTQAGAKSVSAVTLYLKKLGTITAATTISLDVFADSSGPTGSSLGTAATVLTDNIPTAAYTPTVFTFAKPVDLTDAVVYWYVLTGNYTASSSNCILWSSLTVGSGGTLATNDATTWTAVTTEKPLFYDNQYTFTDITGATFTAATTGTTALSTLMFDAASLPVWIRVYCTIGGTSNPNYYVSGIYRGRKTVNN